jgi:glycerol-3-phosphate dehydrogenase
VSGPALGAASREVAFDRLESDVFDCVVIGGGISGAGIAREAALRGLTVALVEARDFASGTSSRSSKLIHGGLRYLALGDVATVRQTALERKIIHRLAPHLAEPCWMLVPARSRAGLAKMRVGLTAYEKLGAVEERDRHHNWSTLDLERGEPTLDTRLHPYACRYREYLTDDARLVLANLRAAAGDGALAVNHAPVESILMQAGRAAGVVARCAETGRTARVRARSVINAAGPWVDAVRAFESPGAKPRLLLSKGVHLVVARDRLPLRNIAILNAADRRSIFAVPRNDIVYLGTTDTAYPAGRDWWPPVTLEDVEYLLEPVRRYFTAPVTADDILSAWAGLRPLIAEPGKPPGEIARKDEVWTGPAGVVTIAGGKLTGYRPMARATVERASAEAGLRPAPAPSQDPVLPGGDFDGDLGQLAARLCAKHGVSEGCAGRLVRLYGAEADPVIALGRQPLCESAPQVLSGEVDWAVQTEAAVHLEDTLYRRMRTALYDPGAREAAVGPAAERMAKLLDWDDDRRSREVTDMNERLRADLTFREEDAT